LRNELLALEGRFNQVKSESLKSIISYDTKTLAINQIRNGAFEFVQQLTYNDLDPTFSPELKLNLDAFNASIQKEETPIVESVTPVKTIVKPTSSPIKETNEKATPTLSNAAPTPLSFPEYEIFVAQYQSTLKAFPKLFRKAREISIRRDMNSATDFHQTLLPHLDALQKFESLLNPIRDNIKQIRLDRNNEIYWLQYKMIKAFPENVEIDKLESIASTLPKLEGLHETLEKLNLI